MRGLIRIAVAPAVASLMWLTAAPAGAAPPAKWTGEQLISGAHDSWEPMIAADPSSSYVYAFYFRYSGPLACQSRCPNPPAVVQSSPDGGTTWNPPVFVCACKGVQGQFDPTIKVTSTGVVYAVWMNWYSTVFAKSTDHGQTWSTPVKVSGAPWTDHPWFGMSPGGKNIYVFWAKGDAYEVASHDYGQTWSAPVKINTDKSHYYYPNGVVVLPGGHVLMAASSYPCGKGTSQCSGPVNINVFRSTDGGGSWTEEFVDTSLFTGPDFPHVLGYDHRSRRGRQRGP
jgi:hypothetical protein